MLDKDVRRLVYQSEATGIFRSRCGMVDAEAALEESLGRTFLLVTLRAANSPSDYSGIETAAPVVRYKVFPRSPSHPHLLMSVYTERWIARPAWLELSISERIAYLDRMDEAFRSLSDSGAKLIGLVLDEEEGEGYERCRYVAVWLMPEGEGLERRLNEILDEADWYDYFDPVIAAPADQPAARMSSFLGQRQPDEV